MKSQTLQIVPVRVVVAKLEGQRKPNVIKFPVAPAQLKRAA